MELLFESRLNLSEFSGRMIFIQHQPTIHPVPVIHPDTFTDRHGASVYGTVLKENGQFRMWYQSLAEDWDLQRDMATVAYAESTDGISWNKPNLDIIKHGTGPNNLCGLQLHSPSIFLDPTAPVSHRYRGTGYVHPGLHMAPPGISKAGYFTAHSHDGLRWKLDSTEPRWRSGDVITSIYHPGQGRAIAAMKYSARVQRIDRRCIHTAELRDGQWSEPISALYPDEYDDIAAMSRGYASCDYYGMGMMAAGTGTVGFLWNYWHSLPYVGKYGNALYGTSDVTLVYQCEPGGKWFHMPGRPSFIDHRAMPWMDGWVYTASCPVDVGAEQRIYFSGMPFEHGFNLDPSWTRNERWANHMIHHCERVIGFASWPRDRLFGVQSPRDGSLVIDLGPVQAPSQLRLNYKTAFGGSIRVEVIDSESHSLSQSLPLTGDETEALAAWQGGTTVLPHGATSLRVRIHFELATLFAYGIEPVDSSSHIDQRAAVSTSLRNSPGTTAGMSLVEILVAMAIIVILLSLGFSAITTAKERATTMKCMSNMRQVSSLIFQYGADHNNDLIPYLTYADPNLGSTWLYWLWAEDYLPKTAYDGLKNGIMTCPARGVPGVYQSDKMQYGMNQYPGFDNKIYKGSPFFKMSKVKRPSQTALLGETLNWYALRIDAMQTINFPHKGYANVIFMDGHGEFLKGPWKYPTDDNSYPFY